jgi:hypothetical protein
MAKNSVFSLSKGWTSQDEMTENENVLVSNGTPNNRHLRFHARFSAGNSNAFFFCPRTNAHGVKN